jgi:hypothetical protein
MSDIFIPRRKPGPRPVECATFRTTVRILGQAQIDTFKAMCALAGRRPHELAYDIVLESIRKAQHDHETQALVSAVRRYQSGRRLVYSGPGSWAGRREMLDTAEEDRDA